LDPAMGTILLTRQVTPVIRIGIPTATDIPTLMVIRMFIRTSGTVIGAAGAGMGTVTDAIRIEAMLPAGTGTGAAMPGTQAEAMLGELVDTSAAGADTLADPADLVMPVASEQRADLAVDAWAASPVMPAASVVDMEAAADASRYSNLNSR